MYVFSLPENRPLGQTIGSVHAIDPDQGDSPVYSILSGSGNGAVAIAATSGLLSIADASKFNFETATNLTLVIQATDRAGLFDRRTVTINITNVNEAPVINAALMSTPEGSANGSLVGRVSASDPDIADRLTYTIVGGNNQRAFAIAPTSGEISVADEARLDFETNPTYVLAVRVTDAQGLSVTNNITIALSDVNEPPRLLRQTFRVNENSPSGTPLGTVVADAIDVNQSLTFAITAGQAKTYLLSIPVQANCV